MDFDSSVQRLTLAGKMFIAKKCTPGQYLAYLRRIVHQLRPESGLDSLDLAFTQERQQRFPGTFQRVLIATKKLEEEKCTPDQFLGYLETLLRRFSSQLREGSSSVAQRADDDRVGLLPHEDPDAYKLLDEYDDGRFPGDFTKDDARRLAAPDALDAPDDFDESGADI